MESCRKQEQIEAILAIQTSNLKNNQYNIMIHILYYILSFIFYPFEYIWRYIFGEKLFIRGEEKILIVDTIGGSGKTTLAGQIEHKFNIPHIRIDDCKFGDGWERFSSDTFIDNIRKGVDRPTFVIEGTFSDPKEINQQRLLKDLVLEKKVDMVIWYDLPKYVALWRKLFRSFKRAIGVEKQGTSVETLNNVKEMCKKGFYTYDDRNIILQDFWDKGFGDISYIWRSKKSWPYFYYV